MNILIASRGFEISCKKRSSYSKYQIWGGSECDKFSNDSRIFFQKENSDPFQTSFILEKWVPFGYLCLVSSKGISTKPKWVNQIVLKHVILRSVCPTGMINVWGTIHKLENSRVHQEPIKGNEKRPLDCFPGEHDGGSITFVPLLALLIRTFRMLKDVFFLTEHETLLSKERHSWRFTRVGKLQWREEEKTSSLFAKCFYEFEASQSIEYVIIDTTCKMRTTQRRQDKCSNT